MFLHRFIKKIVSSAPETQIESIDAVTLIEEGSQHQDAGRLNEALECFRNAALADPQLGRAHFLIGLVLLEQNQPLAAIPALKRALEIKPDSAGAYLNLGNAHMQLGEAALAVEAYQSALMISPEFMEAMLGLGRAFEATGAVSEAIVQYRKLHSLAPQEVESNLNLAHALVAANFTHEAEAILRKAAALFPENIDVSIALADVLTDRRSFDEATQVCAAAKHFAPNDPRPIFQTALIHEMRGNTNEALLGYKETLSKHPDFFLAHNNLGNMFKNLGRHKDSAYHYQRALELAPNSASIYNNLGNALTALGNYEDAFSKFRKATEIDPDFADAWGNWGIALHGLYRHDEAIDLLQKAANLRPDDATILGNLGAIQQERGLLEESMKNLEKSLALAPDDPGVLGNYAGLLRDKGEMPRALEYTKKALALDPNNFQIRSSLLFIMNYVAETPASSLLEEAKVFGRLAADAAQVLPSRSISMDRAKKLRIGLVSGDLIAHPVGYFLEGIMRSLATRTARMHITAYPTRMLSDSVTKHIRSYCHQWSPVQGMSDEDLARCIFEDEIDILIDLSGHTGHNRLPVFAWRPAPIQVTWLGYFATTGMTEIDYLIADPWTLPESEEQHFTETIWRLPETRLCFTPPHHDIPVAPPPARNNGHITFGCFNNLAKLNDKVVALWARVLHGTPSSKLFLKAPQLRSPTARQNMEKKFGEHGISADRLLFEGPSSRTDYFAAYNRVDIALDPFPYTGGTTTVEALWMGVPVLTLSGENFLSRQGVGLLMNAGLPEWVAKDEGEYQRLAALHAQDIAGLTELRRILREKILVSPIFDAERFAGHFEEALRAMWVRRCDEHAST